MTAQQDFINSAAPGAQTSQAATGVPASVTLAQAILESGWGVHHIGTANNYFGIKATRKGTTVDYGSVATGYVEVPTREVINGKDVMVQALFRSYASMADSFRDHGLFLKNNSRYATAFTHSSDGEQFARDVAAAGYATDPHYADALVGLIKKYNLAQYDTVAKPAAAGTGDAVNDRRGHDGRRYDGRGHDGRGHDGRGHHGRGHRRDARHHMTRARRTPARQ